MAELHNQEDYFGKSPVITGVHLNQTAKLVEQVIDQNAKKLKEQFSRSADETVIPQPE